MKRNIALAFIVIVSALMSVQQAFAQQKMDTRFEKITSEARRLMNEIKVPGIAIGIIHDGKVQTAGIGITNR